MTGIQERIIIGRNVPENIKRHADEYAAVCLEAARLREQIIGELAKFQDSCQHEPEGEMEIIREWDPDYTNKIDTPILMRGFNVFAASRCHLCGKDFPRKKGNPHRVCHNCGADMESAGTGRNHGYNVYVSKCTQCGHRHEIAFP